MVESGSCRFKNVQSILLKNLTDVCVGTIGWWMFGWSFAYASGAMEDGLMKNHFAGDFSETFGQTFLSVLDDGRQEPTGKMAGWFFQWAFCATAATIVSGGVAERVLFTAYAAYSGIMTGLIYPVVVYWTWCSEGWLVVKGGYSDFAGSGIVHLTG